MLRKSVPSLVALDVSPAVVARAAARCPDADCRIGDMSDFSLGRTFDLIYTSANTLRHVCAYEAIVRMWSCIANHLEPGGLFLADLELGAAAEADKLARPVCWTIARNQHEVHVTWEVTQPPSSARPCSTIRWTFKSSGGEPRGSWSETFPLRVYDADEFVRLATADGRLALLSIHEPRDPYLVETPVEKAVGRMLVAFRRL
jgi:SAM-dependent methyltransferase